MGLLQVLCAKLEAANDAVDHADMQLAAGEITQAQYDAVNDAARAAHYAANAAAGIRSSRCHPDMYTGMSAEDIVKAYGL